MCVFFSLALLTVSRVNLLFCSSKTKTRCFLGADSEEPIQRRPEIYCLNSIKVSLFLCLCLCVSSWDDSSSVSSGVSDNIDTDDINTGSSVSSYANTPAAQRKVLTTQVGPRMALKLAHTHIHTDSSHSSFGFVAERSTTSIHILYLLKTLFTFICIFYLYVIITRTSTVPFQTFVFLGTTTTTTFLGVVPGVATGENKLCLLNIGNLVSSPYNTCALGMWAHMFSQNPAAGGCYGAE